MRNKFIKICQQKKYTQSAFAEKLFKSFFCSKNYLIREEVCYLNNFHNKRKEKTSMMTLYINTITFNIINILLANDKIIVRGVGKYTHNKSAVFREAFIRYANKIEANKEPKNLSIPLEFKIPKEFKIKVSKYVTKNYIISDFFRDAVDNLLTKEKISLTENFPRDCRNKVVFTTAQIKGLTKLLKKLQNNDYKIIMSDLLSYAVQIYNKSN